MLLRKRVRIRLLLEAQPDSGAPYKCIDTNVYAFLRLIHRFFSKLPSGTHRLQKLRAFSLPILLRYHITLMSVNINMRFDVLYQC